jgi:hypothetical protein
LPSARRRSSPLTIPTACHHPLVRNGNLSRTRSSLDLYPPGACLTLTTVERHVVSGDWIMLRAVQLPDGQKDEGGRDAPLVGPPPLLSHRSSPEVARLAPPRSAQPSAAR